MAKKPAKSDRQAVIEQMRKKQKGADRRRGFAIVGVCSVIALTILALAIFPIVKRNLDLREFNGLALEKIGAPASACQDITTKPADGNQDHVPVNTPVTYTDSPPTFGAHWNEANLAPAPMERKFYTANDRPALEALMHNLEHGYTILWYDETAAEDTAMLNEIEGIASKFSGTSNFRYKFKAVPWTSADGEPFPADQHIALTHWSAGGSGETDTAKQIGVWQYCSEPSGEAVKDFMIEYPYTDSPEPDAM
ncbi:DUF3105 domain-containing protein [Nocardioides sp.]|uniref:DUF3105 domain-containing protein n=1 Tax=Nocardioides sp. TaxID=35761 RepID=UPI0035694135